MAVGERELVAAVATIANERNIRVVVQNSAKGAAICAVSSFVGGLLFGPVGLAAGGAAGGAIAYKSTKGCFRPLSSVLLNDLTIEQRSLLVTQIKNAVRQFQVTDILVLLPLLNNAQIKEAVIKIALEFVTKEMSLQIID